MPAIEVLTSLWLLVTLAASYLLLSGGNPGEPLIATPLIGLLLVANLIPSFVLLVLFGRRLAKGRAARSTVGGNGQLHVRLVGMFSTSAAIPVLMVVVFSSLLFQYGFDFWYSKKARGIFEKANELAQTYYTEKQRALIRETEVMAGDLNYNMELAPLQSDQFQESFAYQIFLRELSQGAILRITPTHGVQSLAVADRGKAPPVKDWVPPDIVRSLLSQKGTVFRDTGSTMEAVTPIPNRPELYVYAADVDDSATLAQTKRFSSVLADYNALSDKS